MTSLSTKVNEIENIIYGFAPPEEGFAKTVYEAMNYSLKAGGKRLRPMLMMETFSMAGGSDGMLKCLHPFMAAIEMIHTYSLIHDDLPALDNDDLRRGKPTNHVVYGEDMAILAGDGLLNFAFETALKAKDYVSTPEDAFLVLEALSILAKKAGIYGMIGGQVVDVEMTGKEMSEAQLAYVYENKTGALIEASMMIGAVLAGANPKDVKAIEGCASNIGLAFQIQDDLLDLLGDAETLGKPTLSDEENGKVTYVTINGVEKSKKDVADLSRKAVETLQSFPNRNEFLEDLILSLINRDK